MHGAHANYPSQKDTTLLSNRCNAECADSAGCGDRLHAQPRARTKAGASQQACKLEERTWGSRRRPASGRGRRCQGYSSCPRAHRSHSSREIRPRGSPLAASYIVAPSALHSGVALLACVARGRWVEGRAGARNCNDMRSNFGLCMCTLGCIEQRTPEGNAMSRQSQQADQSKLNALGVRHSGT